MYCENFSSESVVGKKISSSSEWDVGEFCNTFYANNLLTFKTHKIIRRTQSTCSTSQYNHSVTRYTMHNNVLIFVQSTEVWHTFWGYHAT